MTMNRKRRIKKRGAELKEISEQLKKFIDTIKDDINKNKFCTLIFKIQDGEVIRYEKTHSINLDELKIEITK